MKCDAPFRWGDKTSGTIEAAGAIAVSPTRIYPTLILRVVSGYRRHALNFGKTSKPRRRTLRKLRAATLNVESMTCRSSELERALKKKKSRHYVCVED